MSTLLRLRNFVPRRSDAFNRSAARVGGFSALSYAVEQSFGLIDMFWVAMLGAGAPTAIAIAASVMMVLMASNDVVGGGSVPEITRPLGRGDREGAARAMGRLIAMKMALGVAMASLFLLFMTFGLTLITNDPLILSLAREYGLVIWMLLILNPILGTILTGLRSTDEEASTFWLSILSLAANFCINPVLIFGWFGAPELGIAGAAWATLIAQALAFAIGLPIFLRNRAGVRLKWHHIRLESTICKRVVKVGLPLAGVTTLYHLETLLVTWAAAHFSAEISDGVGIATRLSGFLFAAAFGGAMGVAVTVGLWIGRGKLDEIKASVPAFAVLSCGAMLSLTLPLVIFAPTIMGFFSAVPETVHAGALFLRWAALALTGLAVFHAFAGAFEGAARNLPVLAVVAIFQLGFEFPAIAFLTQQTEIGLNAIWSIVALTAIACAAGLGFLFRQDRWMPRINY